MNLKCVVFDADGTLLEIENPYLSIARGLKCEEQVKDWVKKYLEGELPYGELVEKEAELFRERYLEIYKDVPKTGDLERFFSPPELREGVREIVDYLNATDIKIFVLSTGFYYLVKDLYQLNIARGNIYSNRFLYDTEGEFMGIKTTIEGDKIRAFGKILDEHKIDISGSAYVGDNAFDLKLIQFVLKNSGQVFLFKQGEKEFQIKDIPDSKNIHLISDISDIKNLV